MPEAARTLVWSVRPVREERAKGAAAASIVAASVAGAAWVGGPVLGGIAALVLAGGVGPFFVTTHYRLTPEEVEVASPFQRVRRPWSAFRRAYVGRTGVSLSPFAKHHVLEPYRSIMLRFGSRRDEILEWVRAYGPGTEAAS